MTILSVQARKPAVALAHLSFSWLAVCTKVFRVTAQRQLSFFPSYGKIINVNKKDYNSNISNIKLFVTTAFVVVVGTEYCVYCVHNK